MNNVEIRLKKEKLIQTIKTNLKGGELKTVEKSILDKNDPFLSYLFAKEINGADINSHLNVVINSNDAQMMYTFAMEIPCNKDLIIDGLSRIGDAKWLYFLAWADGVNIDKLLDELIKTNDINYIYSFGTNIPNADKNKIIKYIISTNNIQYINNLGRLGISREERSELIRQAEINNIRKLKISK